MVSITTRQTSSIARIHGLTTSGPALAIGLVGSCGVVRRNGLTGRTCRLSRRRVVDLPVDGSMISTMSLTIEVVVKNSPPFPFGERELAKEVLVDESEAVRPRSSPGGGQAVEAVRPGIVRQSRVGAREDAVEVGVGVLDRLHRIVDRLAEVGAFGEVQEVLEARLVRDEQHPLGVVLTRPDLPTTEPPLPSSSACASSKRLVGVSEEDQPEHRRRVPGRP